MQHSENDIILVKNLWECEIFLNQNNDEKFLNENQIRWT